MTKTLLTLTAALGLTTWASAGDELRLSIDEDCPGPVTVTVENATPNGDIGILFAFERGDFVIPSGICAGVMLELDASVRVVVTVTADDSGMIEFPGEAPAAACDGFVQAIDLTSCRTSNLFGY